MVRTFPISAEIANPTVTISTSAPAARVALLGLPGLVCHTRACTMRSTLSSARVARRSANPATKNERIRCPVERSPIPANAFAANPPIPASRRQAARILARGAGPEAEDHDEQEHVRDHEEEHPERHCAREHPSPGGDVALERARARCR